MNVKKRVTKDRKYPNDVISLINIRCQQEIDSYEKQGMSINVTTINLEQRTSWIRTPVIPLLIRLLTLWHTHTLQHTHTHTQKYTHTHRHTQKWSRLMTKDLQIGLKINGQRKTLQTRLLHYYVWIIYGLYMDYVWIMYELCMDKHMNYVWIISIISSFHRLAVGL